MLELINVAAFTHSKSSEKTNEDSILLPLKMNDGYIFGIADGVGSYPGASFASKFAIQYISTIQKTPNEQNIKEILFEIKNKLVELEKIDEAFYKAATTLTFAYLDNNGLHIIHIGDSRLYLKEENKFICLTKDHTQHQKLLDEGLYTARQLKDMPGKNILTTALSQNIEIEYQYSFMKLNDIIDDKGELVVCLMSDGAYEYWEKRPKFSPNTMGNPTAFSTSLQRRIEKNGPIDDYSLVNAKFKLKPL